MHTYTDTDIHAFVHVYFLTMMHNHAYCGGVDTYPRNSIINLL